MTKLMKTFLLFFLMFLGSISNIFAKTPLSNVEIENYIASLPKIQNVFSSADSPEKDPEIITNPNGRISLTPITDSLEITKQHPAYPDFLKAIKSSGFSSDMEWGQTGDKIMNAYNAYHLNQADLPKEEMIAELQQNMTSVTNNMYISAEQKQTLIHNIEKSIALLNDPNYIDNPDIKTISRYVKRLDSLFKENK